MSNARKKSEIAIHRPTTAAQTETGESPVENQSLRIGDEASPIGNRQSGIFEQGGDLGAPGENPLDPVETTGSEIVKQSANPAAPSEGSHSSIQNPSEPVALTSAIDDPMRISSVSHARDIAHQIAEAKGIPVTAVRAHDIEAKLESSAYDLSKRQALAIDLINRGLAMGEVARRVGVSRRTLYRWRYNHPQFIATYARINRELGEQTSRRAEQLVYQALAIVGQSLSSKDDPALQTTTALRVLGALRVSNLLFTSPGESHFNLALDEIIRKQRLQEELDPNLPITPTEREDALYLIETQNVTDTPEEDPNQSD